jgi:hypothetical protein
MIQSASMPSALSGRTRRQSRSGCARSWTAPDVSKSSNSANSEVSPRSSASNCSADQHLPSRPAGDIAIRTRSAPSPTCFHRRGGSSASRLCATSRAHDSCQMLIPQPSSTSLDLGVSIASVAPTRRPEGPMPCCCDNTHAIVVAWLGPSWCTLMPRRRSMIYLPASVSPLTLLLTSCVPSVQV